VKVLGVPGQLFAVGVTVIVAVTTPTVVFVTVNAGILLAVAPDPRPIDVVLFDQL